MKINKVVVACCNEEKVQEIIKMLSNVGIEAISAREMKLDGIEELGQRFHESAALMAQEIANRTKLPCITEDSGLCVDALGGNPGLYARGYVRKCDYETAMKKVLKEMEEQWDEEERKAHFVCVLTLATPLKGGRQSIEFFEARTKGLVATQIGGKGIGFEPVFIPSVSSGRYEILSQMKPGERAKYSHRAKAMRKLIAYLQEG